MSTVAVEVHRAGSMPRALDLEADLARVRMLANLLDAQFEIAGIKLGWDAVIGLVPVVGDAVSAALGVYPLHIARKHKLGKLLQVRMAGNLLIDWVIGLIPLVGDVFDVGFKANLKNAALLEKAVQRKREASLR